MLFKNNRPNFNEVKCRICFSNLETEVSLHNHVIYPIAFGYILEKPSDKIQDIFPLSKNESCKCYYNNLGCSMCGEVIGIRINLLCKDCMRSMKYLGLCALMPEKIIVDIENK